MKPIKYLVALIPLIFLGCDTNSVRVYECISDSVDLLNRQKEKIVVTIDNKKIKTSNNFVFSYCGDSEDEILGGTLSTYNEVNEHVKNECDGSNKLSINKDKNTIAFIWREKELQPSGEWVNNPKYLFEGKCVPQFKDDSTTILLSSSKTKSDEEFLNKKSTLPSIFLAFPNVNFGFCPKRVNVDYKTSYSRYYAFDETGKNGIVYWSDNITGNLVSRKINLSKDKSYLDLNSKDIFFTPLDPQKDICIVKDFIIIDYRKKITTCVMGSNHVDCISHNKW